MESGEMNTEILGVALQIVLLIVISYPLGKYIAKVYKGEKTWSDFMKPVERLIYKVAGGRDELETVLESPADSECLLVCMGHGATLYTAVVAVKSGWKR